VVDDGVPGGRVVQSVRADVAGIAVVVNLADSRGDISIGLEHLRQRHDIGQVFAEMRLQVVDMRGVGPSGSHASFMFTSRSMPLAAADAALAEIRASQRRGKKR